MEVLKGEALQLSTIEGHSLIQTVVSLTELPEPLAHQEMNQVLELSGHGSERLTMEELRSAMLVYLEAIHAGMVCESESVDDAGNAKSLVILE